MKCGIEGGGERKGGVSMISGSGEILGRLFAFLLLLAYH